MSKKRSLAVRFIVGFVAIGMIMAGFALWFGYNGYRESMEQQYHDNAYLIADTAESLIMETITKEELADFVEVAKGDDEAAKQSVVTLGRYEKMHKDLNSLRETMGLTDIYLTYYTAEELRSYREGDTGWNPLLYILDCYYKEDGVYLLGSRSSMNPKNRELFAEVVETGKKQDKFIISDGDFGYNISALKPILSDSGEVIAVIAVEEPMRLVESSTRTFVLRTMSAILIAIIAVIMFFVFYMYNKVVRPINLIAAEAKRYGNTNEVTAESEKKLRQINTNDEIQFLAESIDKMEKDMLDYVENIKTITAEKERIGAELSLATRIQADMLPNLYPAFPERPEFDIYATMTPAKEVGGDFYDFFLTDDDHLCMVMADVSGKGVPAALFMMASKIILANNAMLGKSPAEILEDTNAAICANNKEEMFVTVWIGILEISTGKLVAANAGHEYPAIRYADGSFELYKDKHGFVIGGMDGVKYREYDLQLTPGARLFVYTDGVAEATNAEDELFGTERMIEALNKNPVAKPKEILENVREAVDGFVKEAEQFDDLTMLCVEYIGGTQKKEDPADGE